MAGVTITNTQPASYATLTLTPRATAAIIGASSPDSGYWTVGSDTETMTTAVNPSNWAYSAGYNGGVSTIIGDDYNITWTSDTIGSGQTLSYDLTQLIRNWQGSLYAPSTPGSGSPVWVDGVNGVQANGTINFVLTSDGVTPATPDAGWFTINGSDFTYDTSSSADSQWFLTGGGWGGTSINVINANATTTAQPTLDGTELNYSPTPGTITALWGTYNVGSDPTAATISYTVAATNVTSTLPPDAGQYDLYYNSSAFFTNVNIGDTAAVSADSYSWGANIDLATAITTGETVVWTNSTAGSFYNPTPTASLQVDSLTISNSSNRLWAPNPTYVDGNDPIYNITIYGNSGDWILNDPNQLTTASVSWDTTTSALQSTLSTLGYNVSVVGNSGNIAALVKTYTVYMSNGAGDTQTITGSEGTLLALAPITMFV